MKINICVLGSINYLHSIFSHPFTMTFLGLSAPGYYGDGLLQKRSAVVLSTAKCLKFNPMTLLSCLLCYNLIVPSYCLFIKTRIGNHFLSLVYVVMN